MTVGLSAFDRLHRGGMWAWLLAVGMLAAGGALMWWHFAQPPLSGIERSVMTDVQGRDPERAPFGGLMLGVLLLYWGVIWGLLLVFASLLDASSTTKRWAVRLALFMLPVGTTAICVWALVASG